MNGAQFRVLLLGWLFALFNGFNAGMVLTYRFEVRLTRLLIGEIMHVEYHYSLLVLQPLNLKQSQLLKNIVIPI